MVERKFYPMLKQYFSSKIGVIVAEKPYVMGTHGYHFKIKREKLVQKHLYFQKRQKSPKNL